MNKLKALSSLLTMKSVTLEPSFIINRHQIYISATPSYVTVDCWTLVVLSGLLIVTIIPCLNDSHVDTVLSVSHNLLLKSSRTGLRIHVLWPCVLYFVCVCVCLTDAIDLLKRQYLRARDVTAVSSDFQRLFQEFPLILIGTFSRLKLKKVYKE